VVLGDRDLVDEVFSAIDDIEKGKRDTFPLASAEIVTIAVTPEWSERFIERFVEVSGQSRLRGELLRRIRRGADFWRLAAEKQRHRAVRADRYTGGAAIGVTLTGIGAILSGTAAIPASGALGLIAIGLFGSVVAGCTHTLPSDRQSDILWDAQQVERLLNTLSSPA
jgi:hypothetical protein